MDVLLSVVIITCNRKDEILKAIESCRIHTQRTFEVVVVDNNSSDGTEDAVRCYCSENAISLQYHYLDRNTGVSFARNIGYREAKGDILFFIDDDAIVTSAGYSLDEVADYMRNNTDVLAATGTSHDYRYGGILNFCKDKMQKLDDLYSVRSYVGFNHFIKSGFNHRDYIYPDNLFYGSEELYVGLTICREKGRTVFYKNHSVQHNPSPNTRIDRREGLKNGHINTYVIKKYFLPGYIQWISWILFAARIIKFCNGNISEIKQCFTLSRERYDKKYNNKMCASATIKAIKQFGFLKVL